MDEYPIPASERANLERIVAQFDRGGRPRREGRPLLHGLWGASAALMTAKIAARSASPLVVVTPDEQEATAFQEDLEFFLRSEVPLYPAFDPRTSVESEARLAFSERLVVLGSILSHQPPQAMVTPLSGLLEPVPSAGDLHRETLTIARGGKIGRDTLSETLARAGFEPTSMVTAPGEFALRGGIVDLFPLGRTRPIRIELFDDEVDSIRDFDLETQRSIAVLDRVDLPLPASQVLRAADGGRSASLCDLISRQTPVIVLEPEITTQRLELYRRELDVAPAIAEAAADFLTLRPGCDLSRTAAGDGGFSYRVLSTQNAARLRAGASGLEETGGDSDGDDDPKARAHSVAQSGIDLKASFDALVKECGRVHVLCQVDAEAKRLEAVLEKDGIRTNGAIRIVIGRVSDGFQFPALGVCVVNHHELLRRLPVRRPRRARAALRSRVLDSFRELRAGDLVVHMVHGIARYEGLSRMKREGGGEEDFMILFFRDDVALYVPVSKIHLVHRYVGGGDGSPSLDRIGASSWGKRRRKVEGALRDLAADLLDTQAVRSEERGFAFGQDDELQELFDASFPYEETEDQIEAIEAIKNDMAIKRPMDRLLCGDVGFGKTELAVRAAFKAVTAGKQAAVLVPTTILAQQHYETFRTRLGEYPVGVAVLSRFQTRARQAEIVRGACEGRVDILIGTHRLFSADVGFRDLGLLVIDEEQRFGVRHKELLKKIKTTVDVLTMTATPIPRTLHMALVGIRDISSLEAAPQGRMPVHTTVEVRNDNLIRRALTLEVSRGGQAFFLHNRVETIARETESLRRLMPDIRIDFAHGQMKERALQNVIVRFIKREIDVLVCTTIIESGIDIPGVNTIIIDRADTFGLADLHQLRGRVGRAHVKAYCYLLTPHRHVSSIAIRRLKAIEELSHLGAGFNIALKDLEIRGAGNILGAEQHGHILAVGYDLYCRLLRATIQAMTTETGSGEPDEEGALALIHDIDLDIQITAFVPPTFVPDEALRIELLRRLSRCKTRHAFAEMKKELVDRFGRLPPETARLIDLFHVRRLMLEAGIRGLTRAKGSREVYVDLFDREKFEGRASFKGAKMNQVSPFKAVLVLPKAKTDPDRLLAYLKSSLMRRRVSV